jgi:hypothetical protein
MLTRVLRQPRLAAAWRLPVLQIRDFRILLIDRMLAPASVAFSVVGVSFAVLDHTGGSIAQLSPAQRLGAAPVGTASVPATLRADAA